MTRNPLLDPVPSPGDAVPQASLRRNGAFVRVWSAATVSVFGSLVTRMALPFVAILTLGAGPVEVAGLRAIELVAMLLVGFAAGAWVDRLRRRPVMIWADLGRAVLLGSIPAAAVLGLLTLPQLFVVTAAAAVLTTFFELADRAYLPTIVAPDDVVRANGALTATMSAVEFTAFGVSGVLVNLLTAPIAILVDAVSFVVSAVLLGSIRRPEPPPTPAAEREPVLTEIAEGLRVVAGDPVLRGLMAGQIGLGVMWGISGGTWLLFVTDTLALNPALIGVVAALGGLGALVGSLAVGRLVARFGLGRVAPVSLLVGGLGGLLVPLAPVGMPIVAVALLLGQQLIGDSAITVFEITETSIQQLRVPARQLGRVNATVRFAPMLAGLVATIAGGFIAEAAGLRVAVFLSPLGTLAGAAFVAASPVRRLRAAADP